MRKKVFFIYYVVVAILAVLIASFSIGSVFSGKSFSKSVVDVNLERAQKRIETLSDEMHQSGSEANEKVFTNIKKMIEEIGYKANVDEGVVDYVGVGDVLLQTKIKNLYVEIDGKNSSNTLVVSVHYDSSKYSANSVSGMTNVVSALEVLQHLQTKEKAFNNDIIFVFLDGNNLMNAGAKQFKTNVLNGVPVKMIANFENFATSGTLCLTDVYQNKNSQVVKHLAKAGIDVETNSLFLKSNEDDTKYSDMDFLMTNNAHGATFGVVSGRHNSGTQNDSVKNVDTGMITDSAVCMAKMADYYGNKDLTKLTGGNSDAVFFNYLNVFNVSYQHIVALIMAIIIVGIILVAMIINRETKAFAFKKYALAMATNIISILVASAVTYLIYLLFSLFGNFGFRLTSPLYMNVADVLLFGGIAIACSIAITYILGKKVFKIGSKHLRYSFITLFAVATLFVTIFAKEISFAFTWLSLLTSLVFMFEVMFANKTTVLKRLRLDSLCAIILMPILVVPFILQMGIYGGVMLPLVALILISFFGFITPTFYNLNINLGKMQIKCVSATAICAVVTAVCILVSCIAPNGANINSTLKEQNLGQFNDSYLYISDVTSNKHYGEIKDVSAYQYVKGKIKGEKRAENGSYVLEENFNLNYEAPLQCVRGESGDVVTFVITIKKAKDDGNYILSAPTLRENKITALEDIKVSYGGLTYDYDFIYTGAEEFVNVELGFDAIISFSYRKIGKKNVTFTYMEQIKNFESAVSGLKSFKDLKDVKGLTLKAYIKQTLER